MQRPQSDGFDSPSARSNTPPQDQPTAPSAVDPYIAWRNPDYRRYAVGWFLLTFGKMIETVAVQVHIHERTRSPLALGLIGLVQALPVMLLAIPGGQIADRLDRRRVMMATLSLSTLVSLGLTFAASQDVEVQWIYGLIFLGAISAALGTPSRAALLPQLVAPEDFSNAVTWNSSVFQIASMTGPAIGGLLIGVQLDTPRALAVVVVCRVLSLWTIWGLRCRPTQRRAESISLESLVAGVTFVWKTKLILATITLDLFAVLLGGATYLLPVFSREILGVGATGLGFLRTSEAVGAVVMAVLLAHLPPMRRAGRTLLWAVGGFGLATIVFGLSQNYLLSLAMMFLIGALDNISVVVRHTLVQMLTPDSMRGRVSAVNSVFIVASNDLGGLESGLVAALIGPVASVVFGGIGTILVVLGAGRIWPQILAIGSLQDIRPEEKTAALSDQEEEAAARA